MAENSLEKTDVFQFMVIRAPNSVAPKPSQRNYIKDEVIDRKGRREADLFSAGSDSEIGKLVYRKVFCDNTRIDFSTDFQPESTTPDDILTYDYPGATYTSLNGINKDGLICGYYGDAAGVSHGFVARVNLTGSGKPNTNAPMAPVKPAYALPQVPGIAMPAL